MPPQAGDQCDSYCGNGARCVRGLCECAEGYSPDSKGYCQQQTDQNAANGNEAVETQSGIDQNIVQPQDGYIVSLKLLIVKFKKKYF